MTCTPGQGGFCFNPRPPISWRATRSRDKRNTIDTKVSIHAHQFHGGRRWGPVYYSWYTVFQSTPTNFMAGDRREQRRCRACQQVSIHAHQFHGGRLVNRSHLSGSTGVSIHAHQFHGGRRREVDHQLDLGPVSIHAHQFHGGRPATRSSMAGGGRRFNPRPPISWRATRIRPRWSAASSTFQSTPTNFMAGDPPTKARPISRSCFNPRPPISWRATG